MGPETFWKRYSVRTVSAGHYTGTTEANLGTIRALPPGQLWLPTVKRGQINSLDTRAI